MTPEAAALITPEGSRFLIIVGLLAIFWLGASFAWLDEIEKNRGTFLAFFVFALSAIGHLVAIGLLIAQIIFAFTAQT